MSQKHNNLSALGEKIAHKKSQSSTYKKFENADEILDQTKEQPRERIIRKSYALTKADIANIQLIKDKCLNKKVVLSDSHIIRLSLKLATDFSENELIEASTNIQKILTGRPKKNS